jgi:hypothetical protein
MKDKILDILLRHEKSHLEADIGYGHINPTDSIPAKAVSLFDKEGAAEAIAQLMCDEAASALRCYTDGKNWENDTIMQLESEGYTKEQIINSLSKIKAAIHKITFQKP